ncbi:MAG TPA: hypothetical protein VGL66_02740 [Caulobacteraceae bacterium]|jgi:hypothetical protein
MMPEVEHHHHHHPTGHRRLDLILPICALFVSVVSLVLAIIHGQAMERMADANTRLVQAQSWPFLEYSTGDIDEGRQEIELRVGNVGVGPAKLRTVELFWRGQPMPNHTALLQRCCGAGRIMPPGLFINQIGNRVLPARDTESFISLRGTDANAAVWTRLDTERLNVSTRICYCSVFDECWVATLNMQAPTTQRAVKRCPVPAAPYTG